MDRASEPALDEAMEGLGEKGVVDSSSGPEEEDGLTLRAAAIRLGINEKTLRRRIEKGEVRAERIPGKFTEEWRVHLPREEGASALQSGVDAAAATPEAAALGEDRGHLADAIARVVVDRYEATLKRIGEMDAMERQVEDLRAAREEMTERLIESEARAKAAEMRAEEAERQSEEVYRSFIQSIEAREEALALPAPSKPETAAQGLLSSGVVGAAFSLSAVAAAAAPQIWGPVSLASDHRLIPLPALLGLIGLAVGWLSRGRPDREERIAGWIAVYAGLGVLAFCAALFRVDS